MKTSDGGEHSCDTRTSADHTTDKGSGTAEFRIRGLLKMNGFCATAVSAVWNSRDFRSFSRLTEPWHNFFNRLLRALSSIESWRSVSPILDP